MCVFELKEGQNYWSLSNVNLEVALVNYYLLHWHIQDAS